MLKSGGKKKKELFSEILADIQNRGEKHILINLGNNIYILFIYYFYLFLTIMQANWIKFEYRSREFNISQLIIDEVEANSAVSSILVSKCYHNRYLIAIS